MCYPYFLFLYNYKFLVIKKIFILWLFGCIASSKVPFFTDNKDLLKAYIRIDCVIGHGKIQIWPFSEWCCFPNKRKFTGGDSSLSQQRELPAQTGSSVFFMPTQINKVIDLLLSDILRGRARYYIRLLKKARNLYIRLFAILSRVIAHRYNRLGTVS